MKKIVVLLSFLAFLFSTRISAQGTHPNDPLKVPDVLPKSPEVTNLGRYGDIPVSEYTGIPDISIPLYEVKIGDIVVPIKLSYYAGGIKVDQEASNVGLGWNLIAGGSITYMPVGGDERIHFGFNPSYPQNWSGWQGMFHYFNEDGYSPFIGGGYTYDMFPSYHPPLSYDLFTNVWAGFGEPDVFSVSFLNYSFSFVLHPETGEPIFVGKKNKCKIEVTGSEQSIGFIITGEDGIKYIFSEDEYIYLNSTPVTSCWYLKEIIDLKGNTVIFNYSNYGYIYPIARLTEIMGTQVNNDPIGGVGIFSNGSYSELRRNLDISEYDITNKYLTEIVTDKETVKFNNIQGRSDINGNGATKLDNIIVTDNITNIDKIKYKFDYDWFIACNIGGDYLTDDNVQRNIFNPPSADNISKRLKLVDIKRVNPSDINVVSDEYIFSYNEANALPKKTSFAKDFWGFYNGQENTSNLMPNNAGHTLIPDAYLLSNTVSDYANILDFFKTRNGANRGMSSTYVTSGMLQSITYPTGGKTVFEFEPHITSNLSYISAEDANIIDPSSNSTYYVWDYNDASGGSSQKSVPFTIPSKILVHVVGTIGSSLYNASDVVGSYVCIDGADQGTNYHKCYSFDNQYATYPMLFDESFYLEAGNYKITCDLAATVPYTQHNMVVNGNITYKPFNTPLIANAKRIGGGVRIKKITNYDQNNNLSSATQYSYINEDGTSSGISILPQLNYKSDFYTVGYSTSGDCQFSGFTTGNKFTLSADNQSSIAIPGSSPNIGYGRVEIQQLIGSTNNGTVIKYFDNDGGTVNNNRVYPFLSTNGNLNKSITLSSSSDTVKVESDSYLNSDIITERINTQITDNYYGPEFHLGPADGCPHAIFNRWSILAYLNYNFVNQLQKKEVVDYFGTQKVKSVTEYTYNATNYCIDLTKETNSNNKIKYLEYKYPNDFAPTYPYLAMLNANRINPVIETTELIGDPQVQIQRTKTNYISSIINPDNVEEQNGSNSTETRLYYDSYDSRGNLLQYHKSNDINVSYIWGYKNMLPIAKVVNAKYTDIFYTSFEELSSTVDNNCRTGVKLCTTSINIILSNLTNGSYVLTYWKRTNGVWALTTTAVTVTGNTYQINISASAVTPIDEVRFYPVGAQMTTYTYDPIFGMTSSTDENNVTTYYEYDSFGRLLRARDNNGNILKEYQYHYKNQ